MKVIRVIKLELKLKLVVVSIGLFCGERKKERESVMREKDLIVVE